MRVKAEGAGYAGIYRARECDRGWYFVERRGTYLTPGIGRPMFCPTADELLEAVRATSGARITVLPDEAPDPYG